MKKIYVLLMHTNTIPSKIVKFFTKYKYSHVGIALERDCNIIYSFGRKRVNSILDGGFSVEHKEGEFFSKFNKAICKIYEVDITDEQYNSVCKIINEMELNKDKYKYDFLGIIPRFFGIPITIKDKYVCSYFIAYILEKSNIYNFDKNICFVKPKDFDSIEGFKEIYIGNYQSYNIS